MPLSLTSPPTSGIFQRDRVMGLFPKRLNQSIAFARWSRKSGARVQALRFDSRTRFANRQKIDQVALKKLIEVSELIVVVGGRQSNNTRQLVETCRAAGKRALHVERPEELQPEWFRGVRLVGLTGGTSTLPETVEAVRQRLEEFHD